MSNNNIKIGDKVRFLDAEGGGKVTGFLPNGLVKVEDADGFEIPTLASQCVVVNDEDDQRQAGHAPVHQAPLSKTQQVAREALTEVERLKEQVRVLKERIHALEAENSDLKLSLLKAQYNAPKNDKPGKGKAATAANKPYEVLRNGVVEVDLHINALMENTAGMDNAAMLQHQMGVFRQTMLSYARARGQKIVFIHGKGEGVLRKAIIDELRQRWSHCEWQDASFQQYGFGATMVIIHA